MSELDETQAAPNFNTTCWDLVASSTDEAALGELITRYWPPVYAYLRCRRYTREQAQDLVQDFFVYLMERELLSKAEEGRGRFRSYLLGILKRFLSDERDRQMAKKRRPENGWVSMDILEDSGIDALVGQHDDPEHVYHQNWARVLLSRVMERLGEESRERGKDWYPSLVELVYFSPQDDKPRYRDLAEEFEISLDEVSNSLKAAKKLYAKILREEISKTLVAGDDVDAEVREIIALLSH